MGTLNLSFVALLLVIGLGVGLVVRSFRGGAKKIAEPTCGQCGYCVRGIVTLVCPECGSDLREVGIISPYHSPKGTPSIIWIALWTLAFPVPAFLLSLLLMATVLPYCQTMKMSRDITLQAPYLNTTIQVWGERRLWQPALMGRPMIAPDEVMLRDSAGRGYMDVNLSTGAYDYSSWGPPWLRGSGNGFNGSVVATWLAANKYMVDQRVRDLSDGIAAAVKEIPTVAVSGATTNLKDRSGTVVGTAGSVMTWYVHDEPHPAVIVGLCLFWLIVWIYGARRIYRWSNR
jgi:hypothetical protein